MPTTKAAKWDATVEMDQKINLMMSIVSKKYGVRVSVDSNYEKGTISIKIKED